jgi:ArsR family transcriptional regulator
MAMTPVELLLTVAEPTRLRILNCLVAAPLVVADLQAILALPQPTVSRHLATLRQANVVHDTPIGPFVLYRLRPSGSEAGRLLRNILNSLASDPALRAERQQATVRRRLHPRERQGTGRP